MHIEKGFGRLLLDFVHLSALRGIISDFGPLAYSSINLKIEI